MDSDSGTEKDVCSLVQPVIALAEDAARRILEVYRRTGDIRVQQKHDRSPLTEADLAAHHAILAGLGVLTPDFPVLSEESAAIPFAERQGWRTYWLVDPLDGTKEFIRRNGEFTINIGLVHDHLPVLGVVYVPVSGLCYYACRGQGAFKREDGDEPTRIHVRRVPAKRITVAVSRSHPSEDLQDFLRSLGDYEVIPMGSALKSCLVAEGRADVYARLGPTGEWDTAAAQCVVEEAGGALTDTGRAPLRYNTRASLINPHFLAVGDPGFAWDRFVPMPGHARPRAALEG